MKPIDRLNITLRAEEAVRICPDIATDVLKVFPMSMSSKLVTNVGRAVIALDMTRDGMVSLDSVYSCLFFSIFS